MWATLAAALLYLLPQLYIAAEQMLKQWATPTPPPPPKQTKGSKQKETETIETETETTETN